MKIFGKNISDSLKQGSLDRVFGSILLRIDSVALVPLIPVQSHRMYRIGM